MNSYIGIDVHQDEYHATIQDEDGMTVKQGYFQNSPSGYDDFFDGTCEGTVAIEAGDAWQPTYDWLDEKGFEVKLADPHKLRIIAEVKIKTDCRVFTRSFGKDPAFHSRKVNFELLGSFEG